jgi:enoyl-CoA hydratase
MSREAFAVAIEDGIADVSLLGPGKGNAMGPAFWRECPELFDELDADDDVRVVLLRGSGANFSYGLDLMAMASELGELLTGEPGARERTKLLDVIAHMQAAPDRISRCRKPVIAAVQGWCIGGGLDLISACDIRLCSGDARFSLREVKVAMVADIGSLQRLPAIIGEGATRELAFTGKDIDAERARGIGLVSDVYETPDALLTAARALAADIAANPPLVVEGIKRVMDDRVRSELDEGLRRVATWNAAFLPSRDLMEAIGAFAERRPPKFEGR